VPTSANTRPNSLSKPCQTHSPVRLEKCKNLGKWRLGTEGTPYYPLAGGGICGHQTDTPSLRLSDSPSECCRAFPLGPSGSDSRRFPLRLVTVSLASRYFSPIPAKSRYFPQFPAGELVGLPLIQNQKSQFKNPLPARFPRNAKTSVNTALSRFQECKNPGKMRVVTLVTLVTLPNPGRGGESFQSSARLFVCFAV